MSYYYLRVFLQYIAFGLVIPISVIWQLNSGLSLAQVAITESIFLAAIFLFEIPAGVFADRKSNKYALVVGTIIHITSMIVFFAGGSFLAFAAALFLQGVGWAFISGSDEALMHDDFNDSSSFKSKLVKANLADETGTIIGLLLSSCLLAVGLQVDVVFLIAAFFLILVLAVSVLKLPNVLHEATKKRKILFHKSYIIKYGLIFIGLAILYEAGRFVWQPLLVSNGIDIQNLGLAYVFFKIFSLVGVYGASKVDFSFKRFMAIALVFGIAPILLMTNILVITFVGFAILLCVENIYRIFQSNYLNNLVSRNRATFLSFASLSRGMIGSVFVLSLAAPALTSITYVLATLVSLKVIVVVIFVLFYKEQKAL